MALLWLKFCIGTVSPREPAPQSPEEALELGARGGGGGGGAAAGGGGEREGGDEAERDRTFNTIELTHTDHGLPEGTARIPQSVTIRWKGP